MPQYDYRCKDCGKKFTKIMGIKEHDTAKVKCPKCDSLEVTQLISSFVPITSKKS
jgi:putative FmdB family regulatory protein